MGEDLRERFQTLHEIVRAAHQTLDPGAWDYLAGGTETETTLRRNRQALDSIAFRPRVLRDVSKVDTTATLLGRTLRLPIMLAPVGSIETFTPGGAATAARGATTFRCGSRASRPPKTPRSRASTAWKASTCPITAAASSTTAAAAPTSFPRSWRACGSARSSSSTGRSCGAPTW